MEHLAKRRQVLHDLPTTANCADGESTADHLAEAGQVRSYVVLGLRSAKTKSETGDHLIEDEKSTDAITRRSESFEKPRRGCDNAHVRSHRLDDHTRHVVSNLGNDVVGGNDRVGHGFFWHACGSRQSKRRHTTATGG